MPEEILQLFYTNAVVLGVGAFVMIVTSYIYLRPYRRVFMLMLVVPTVAAAAYLAMGSNLGFIETGDGIVNTVRYIDWVITTPILLYVLSYAMIPEPDKRWRTFLNLAGLDIVMLATGLFAELAVGMWVAIFFGISGIAYLVMLYIIVARLLGLDSADISKSRRRIALIMAWVILLLWSVYPFIWIFGTQGTVAIGLRAETLAYMVLDVVTKIGFAGLLLRYLYIEVSAMTT